MPRKGDVFVSKFLIPSLDQERFGTRLKWIDRENLIFQVQWNHKSTHTWTKYDAVVFTEWDKMKGRYEPSSGDYFSKSKQRFRAMLYKLTTAQQLHRLKSPNKHFHVFSIVGVENTKNKAFIHENISNIEAEGNPECQTSDFDKENISLGIVSNDHGYSVQKNPVSFNFTEENSFQNALMSAHTIANDIKSKNFDKAAKNDFGAQLKITENGIKFHNTETTSAQTNVGEAQNINFDLTSKNCAVSTEEIMQFKIAEISDNNLIEDLVLSSNVSLELCPSCNQILTDGSCSNIYCCSNRQYFFESVPETMHVELQLCDLLQME